MRTTCGASAATARALTEHTDFDWKNPNRFRSVLGALAMNAAGFHDPSGASYRLFADWLIRLDPLNPQTTARMCTAFETWRRTHTVDLLYLAGGGIVAHPDGPAGGVAAIRQAWEASVAGRTLEEIHSLDPAAKVVVITGRAEREHALDAVDMVKGP